MRSKRISVRQMNRPYTRPKMTTFKTLTFNKTMTVYVAQCLTFEQFKSGYMFQGKESREEFDEKCKAVWERMCEKAGNHGDIYLPDGEDSDNNDYNCEEDIEDMVEELVEEIKKEED